VDINIKMTLKFGNTIIRPEIDSAKYWVHVVIIAFIIQIILKYSFGYDTSPGTIETFYFSYAIAISDIIAHTILGFD